MPKWALRVWSNKEKAYIVIKQKKRINEILTTSKNNLKFEKIFSIFFFFLRKKDYSAEQWCSLKN